MFIHIYIYTFIHIYIYIYIYDTMYEQAEELDRFLCREKLEVRAASPSVRTSTADASVLCVVFVVCRESCAVSCVLRVDVVLRVVSYV